LTCSQAIQRPTRRSSQRATGARLLRGGTRHRIPRPSKCWKALVNHAATNRPVKPPLNLILHKLVELGIVSLLIRQVALHAGQNLIHKSRALCFE